MTLQAAILEKPWNFVLKELPLPALENDEILVCTKACGICTSELGMWEGKSIGLDFPRFIGHEPAGVVAAGGKDVKSISPGDRVAVWSDGKGYAEQLVTREDYVYKLANETKFEQALGEPIACATNGVRKADPQLNDSVCIVGCGFMGLIMLQILKVRGAGMLIAVDTRNSILETAKTLGASHTLNPGRDNVKEAIKELTGGRGVDLGIEGAGSQKTLDLTTELVRMEGKLEVFGYHQGPARQVKWGYWNWMAFQIINGHTRSPKIYVEGMRIGLGLLEAGKLRMEPLITHRFALREINRGFQVASAKQEGFVKGVIVL